MQASEKDLAQVTALFEQLGAQTEQASILAKQLLKLAEQLSIERKISLVESTDSLLRQVIRARQGLPPEVES